MVNKIKNYRWQEWILHMSNTIIAVIQVCNLLLIKVQSRNRYSLVQSKAGAAFSTN